jgi:hypothetical protein
MGESTRGLDPNMKHPSSRFIRHTKGKDALGILKVFGCGIAIKVMKTLSSTIPFH